MTTLAAQPVDTLQGDLLALIGEGHTVTRKPLADIFRAACETERDTLGVIDDVDHGGYGWINPNAVRARVLADFAAGLVDCDDPEMNHRQYSALWSPACAPNGYLDKTDEQVLIDARHSRGNGNKAVLWRRWRGLPS